ncbi:hypothetical protein F5888DRAFT_1810492 [Russula emetica]|nr:hypothetical protein F5888DRAFT_1810492 [Russula emetica]
MGRRAASSSLRQTSQLSSNDHVGSSAIEISELAENGPKMGPDTGLYPEDKDDTRTFQSYKPPLAIAKETPWESKRSLITVSHTNHILLYGNNFGPNHSSTATQTTLSQLSVSHIELTSVLDSLGPTDSGAASETRLPDLLKPHSPYR